MNRKLMIFFLIVGSIVFTSCQKDSDIFVPDNGQIAGPDTSWYSIITPSMPVSVLKNNLTLPVYADSFEVNNNNTYVITPFGLQCGFPPHCCVGNAGQTITGFVKVELVLIKKKGDIIQLNRPTISNNKLLINGGEVFVRLTQNGQDLQLAPNAKIQIRFPIDSPFFNQTKLFFGDESNTERFNWIANTDLVNNTLNINTQTLNYEIQTNHLRWISCDSLYNAGTNQQTVVTATLDPQFTNGNTIAYVVFKDFRSVVGMYGDNISRKFSSGPLPVGKDITVVVISRQGNDYFMDHKIVTTLSPTTSPGSQSVLVKPVITTLANIKSYLGTL